MSTIALPPAFLPSMCSFKSVVSQRVSASPFGGSEQAIDLLNDRWTCSVTIPMMTYQQGGQIEAFIGAMRGQTNTANLWHFVRPAPAGTARGSMTILYYAAQGSEYIGISGCIPTNGTLLAGDMLNVNGMLLMLRENSTAVGGNITVALAQRLRKPVSVGMVVTWDKAPAAFRLLNTSGVNYNGAVVEDVTFDFGEAI